MKTDAIPVVLMADDDEDDCMLARHAFKACGAPGRFAYVGDGTALLEYLSRSPIPAVILLDISMPLMDGYETLEEIKAIPAYQGIPIVIFTTSQKENLDLKRVTEATSIITKPSIYSGWIDIMRTIAHRWLMVE
jgi:CheY-like chemotaxis protein